MRKKSLEILVPPVPHAAEQGQALALPPEHLPLEAPAQATMGLPDVSVSAINEGLAELTARSIRTLRVQIDRLEANQARFKGTAFDIRQLMSNEAAMLSRAVAQLTDAVRKREQTIRDIVLNMTPDEQEELVRAYIKTMPPARLAALKNWILGQEEVDVLG